MLECQSARGQDRADSPLSLTDRHEMSVHATIPVVLALSGMDPTGGAGIQADIESLASMGCHAAPVVTALTVQDTRRLTEYAPVDAGLLRRQIETLLADMPIAACKIGMVGSAENARVIHEILARHTNIPLVLDPVLVAGGGGAMADAATRTALTERLVPLATLVTPNESEARALVPTATDTAAAAQGLLALGAEYVLVTGADSAGPEVVNTLYGHHQQVETCRWQRLPGSYHGSGCTLAAAIAGLLAHGADPLSAAREGQEYVWETLRQAYRIGGGQAVPNRLFWALHEKGRST